MTLNLNNFGLINTTTRQTAANSSGNTVLNDIDPNVTQHTVVVTITGSARTSEIALPIRNRKIGHRVAIKLILPATDLIIINLRNDTVGGTILKTLTTDTSGDDATIWLNFDGTAWELLGYNYPI